MTAVSANDVAKLVTYAETILRSSSMYRESNELDGFRGLVEVVRQKQEEWEEKLKSHDSEEVPADKVANDPRTWESVEEATKKVEEEINRLRKIRISARLSLLVSACCSSGCFYLADFPQDLMDALQQVVDAMEPAQMLQELVNSFHNALSQHRNADILNQMLKEISAELSKRQNIGVGGKRNISLMHRAAFAGFDTLLHGLMRMTGRVSNINAVDSDGQTPLHYATIAGQTSAARILLGHAKLRANEEDLNNQTALQIAVEMRKKDIEKLLIERAEVQHYVDRLFRDRQVYVDAANAILVGAALIASVTYGGWLQPPGGFVAYQNFPSTYPGVPDTYESFAAVGMSASVRVFWVFNSLSFFSAVATVVAGAACVLPMTDAFIKHEVRMVRRSLVVTSILLVISIVFVLAAFAAAGFASLPPSPNYLPNIISTAFVGLLVCLATLIWFLRRLYRIRPAWWRQMEEDMFIRSPRKSSRLESNRYFIN